MDNESNKIIEKIKKRLQKNEVSYEDWKKRTEMMDEQEIKDKLIKSIPDKFQGVFLSGKTDENKISPIAKKYIETKAWEKGLWTFLFGSRSGSGKSFDTAWIMYKKMKTNFYWVQPNTIIRSYFNDSTYFNDIMKSTTLVIDDLSWVMLEEGDGDKVRSIFHELIDYRANIQMLCTHFTSNKGLSEIEKTYGIYITRRIIDMCEIKDDAGKVVESFINIKV